MNPHIEAGMPQLEYQKWDYITLSDFRSASLGKVFSYVWLWFLAIVAVAVYTADTYTAVNLLVFDRWSGGIKPTIPFSISRWIFAGCILFSWVLAIYAWIRSVAVMRRNNVAECYLDPLTVTLQSMRVTRKGRGWRRFLVFAALTKSRKGADYVALFTYFQFKGAIRILLAEGPRQAINALSLYSVAKAQLLPKGQNPGNSILQFFKNINHLLQTDKQQATTLFTMMFTFVIWAVSFLSFLAACLAYIFFLRQYIPKEFGSLTKYCRRKIDKRLDRIVSNKVHEAMAREDAKLARADKDLLKPDFSSIARKPTFPALSDTSSDFGTTLSRTDSTWKPPQSSSSQKSFSSTARLIRQPTLPQVEDSQLNNPSQHTLLSESTKEPTLPTLDANVDGMKEPTLPQLSEPGNYPVRPGGPIRSTTQMSGLSVGSNQSDQPLLSQTEQRGYTASPGPMEQGPPSRSPFRQDINNQHPPPSRLQSSTPYPGDDRPMGRDVTAKTPSPSNFIPPRVEGPPPNRPLPAYPIQMKRDRRPNPGPGPSLQSTAGQNYAPQLSNDIELKPQPPPSLRAGPSPALQQPSMYDSGYAPANARGPPPRSATTGPGMYNSFAPPPSRLGSALPMRNDNNGFGPSARSATAGPGMHNNVAAPSSRLGSAPPMRNGDDNFGPPARSGTAPPAQYTRPDASQAYRPGYGDGYGYGRGPGQAGPPPRRPTGPSADYAREPGWNGNPNANGYGSGYGSGYGQGQGNQGPAAYGGYRGY